MNLLLLTTKLPYPPREGMTLRSFHLVRALAQRHRVFLLSLLQGPGEEEGVAHLRQWCACVETFRVPSSFSRLRLAAALARSVFSPLPFVCLKYDVPEMRARVRELAGQVRFDAVHYDVLPLTVYRTETPLVPGVLIEQNVESSLLERRAACERNLLRRSFLRHQWRKLAAFEKYACNLVPRCVAVSDLDRQAIMALAPGSNVTVIPNGTDTGYFTPDRSHERRDRIVFVGSQTWHPNRDGLRFFLREVFPLIRGEVPGVMLDIIGKTAGRSCVPARYRSCVTEYGTVEDIRPHVLGAAVYVVPLRVGGGTRLKILDAMAMGRAIVSTPVGCEGIEATNGKNIIVAGSAGEFARQTVRLLRDAGARRRLGEQARLLAGQRYDWKTVYASIDDVYAGKRTGNAMPAFRQPAVAGVP